jgi:nucleoside-diphosphate-sugar epimerase
MSLIAVFGCGGYLARSTVATLASTNHNLKLFSTSSNKLCLGSRSQSTLPFSPLTCPPTEVFDADLVLNFCAEGVGHKAYYGTPTLLRNIEIATSCAMLASVSKGRRLLHVGSVHEAKMSACHDAVRECVSSGLGKNIHPIDSYALSKSMQTTAISQLVKTFNISATIVLPPNIYGPPNPPNSLAGHLDRVLNDGIDIALANPESVIRALHVTDFGIGLKNIAESFMAQPPAGFCHVATLDSEISTVGEFAERYMAFARAC